MTDAATFGTLLYLIAKKISEKIISLAGYLQCQSIHVTNCGSLFTFIGIADSAVRHKWMRLYYLRLLLIVLLYL